MRKHIKLIEVASELGAGTRGGSLGIGAIKVASLNLGSDFFAKYSSVVIPNENHVLYDNLDTSFAKYIKPFTGVCKRLSNTLSEVMKDNYLPIVLAGDHSTAAGTIAGIKQTFPNQKLGVIWLDAHGDLHSPYTTPSGNINGMSLAIALAEDNPDKSVNEISKTITKYWQELKHLSGVTPNINYNDLVFIGLRNTEPEENYLIEKHNIKKITVNDVRDTGTEKIVKEIYAYLSHCDLIYLSFDVDSLDCNEVSHGTGTPVSMGFSELEITTMLLQLLKNDKLCCFEITEVNPTLDEKGNVMAETAFRILEKSVNILKNNN